MNQQSEPEKKILIHFPHPCVSLEGFFLFKSLSLIGRHVELFKKMRISIIYNVCNLIELSHKRVGII